MNRTAAYLILLTAILSCTKAGDGPGIYESGRPDIILGSGDAVSSDFPDGKEGVFAVTAYRGTAAPSADYGDAYFENIPVDTDDNGRLSFAPPQYYPADESKLYFYAYSPAATGTPDENTVRHASYNPGNGATAPEIDFTIDGTQDILWAKEDRGTGKYDTGSLAFNFRHLLQQVRFRLIMGDGYGDDISATAIRLTGCRTQATLDLINGQLTFSDTADKALEMTGDFPITRDGTETESLLCEPSETIHVEIDAAGVTYSTDVMLQTPESSGNPAGQAGVSYLVSLTFKGTQIEPSTNITKWENGGSWEGTLTPATVPLYFSTSIVADSRTKAPIEGDGFPSNENRYDIGMWVCRQDNRNGQDGQGDTDSFEPAMPGYDNLLAGLRVDAIDGDVWVYQYDGSGFHNRLDIRRGQTVDIYAYYPHQPDGSGKFDPRSVPFTTGETDWMWAEKQSVSDADGGSVSVRLNFSHAMTCLQVNIKAKYEVRLLTMKLKDSKSRLYEEGTMDIVERKLNLDSPVQELIRPNINQTIPVEYSPSFHILMPPVNDYKENELTLCFEFDNAPGEFMNFSLPVKMNDGSPINGFEAGKRYKYNLTLDNEVTFEPVGIDDTWVTEEDIEIIL